MVTSVSTKSFHSRKMRLFFMVLCSGVFGTPALSKPTEYRVDLCSRRGSVLMCHESGTFIQLFPGECPKHVQKSTCVEYRNEFEKATMRCNDKVQCRISVSSSLKDACKNLKTSLYVTFTCKTKTVVDKGLDFFEKETKINPVTRPSKPMIGTDARSERVTITTLTEEQIKTTSDLITSSVTSTVPLPTPKEFKVDLCSRRGSVLMCHESLIQLYPGECPKHVQSSTCVEYRSEFEKATKRCNQKVQCRISVSRSLKDDCKKLKTSFYVTFKCQTKTAIDKGLDFFEKEITTNPVATPSTEEKTKITSDLMVDPTAAVSISTPVETVKMKTPVKSTKTETTRTTTTSENTIPKTATAITTTSTSTASLSTATSTTSKTSTATTSTTKASQTLSTTTLIANSVNTNMEESNAEGIDKVKNLTTTINPRQGTNFRVPTLPDDLSKKCLFKNGTFKENGDYEWEDYANPRCYIQCHNGKSNWQCCQKNFYFDTRCKTCMLPSHKGRCADNDKNNFITGYCMKETVGNDEFKGRYTFRAAGPFRVVKKNCKYGTMAGQRGSFDRMCLFDNDQAAYWEPLNLTKCAPKNVALRELLNLNANKISNDNAVDISQRLLQISTMKKEFSTKPNLRYTVDLLNKTASYMAVSEKVCHNLVSVIDSLNSVEPELISSSFANPILTVINKIGKLIPLPTSQSSVSVSRSTICIAATKPRNKTVSFLINAHGNLSGTIGTAPGTGSEQSISIPASAIESFGEDTRIYFYALRNSHLFTDGQKDSVQSVILSATVDVKENIKGLVEPVRIKLLKKNINQRVTCKYWETVNETFGRWLSDGCNTVEDGNSHKVTCECNHLTNFALILDPEQKQSTSSKELKVVSFIGCLVSILGLGVTLATFICFRRLRKKLAGKILICLCVSLLLLLVVFVAGVNQTQLPAVCHIVAGLLHYLTLSTFSWMLVEALHLHRTLVRVFTRGRNARFFKLSFLYAWGTPAVIVGVTGYLLRGHFHQSMHSRLCLVTGPAFYYALLLPVCIILLINSVIFVPVLRGVVRGDRLLKDSIQDRQKAHARRAKASSMIVVVLGFTWTFGVLAVGDLRDVFQWLFCILSSLQGFFIFVLYVVMNKDACEVWSGLCCKSSTRTSKTSSKESKMRMIQQSSTDEPSIIINGEAYGYSTEKSKLKDTEQNSDIEDGAV